MHIESTNYASRWNQRRSGTIHNADAVQRPTSWSSISVKSRTIRKPKISHSLSTQASSTLQNHLPNQPLPHDTNALKIRKTNDSVSYLDTSHQSEDEFDRQRRATTATYPGPYYASHVYNDTSYSQCCSTSIYDQINPTHYQLKQDKNIPNPLPAHIVHKLKERFEKRVLRHNQTSKSHDTSWSGSATMNLHSKPGKYQLIAGFLVNKGTVEAWHNYAPLPVDIGQNSEEVTGTRMLELTQRRLRLIQRYYSSARQYVILYVNSNYAEHYLPMGLAEDPHSITEIGSWKRPRERNKSQPVLITKSHQLVSHFLSTVLKPQQRSSSANEVAISPLEDPQFCPQLGKMSLAESDIPFSSIRNNRLRRNQSLPPYTQCDKHVCSVETKTSTSNSCVPSRAVSQTHGGSFIRRVFENIWASYTRPSGSKSENAVTSREEDFFENSTERGPSSSAGHVFVRGVKSTSGIKEPEDTHEKESTSSGLIDFSSSTGSTSSDHFTFTQTDVRLSPRDDTHLQQISKANNQYLSDQRSQVWFPKLFTAK